MDIVLFCFLSFLSIVGSSIAINCPPSPEYFQPCNNMYEMRFKRTAVQRFPIPDCHVSGCPEGQVCCSDYCYGYKCVHSHVGPEHICPLIKCGPHPKGTCPHGFIKDKNGCPTCTCKVVCPLIKCAMPPGGGCPNGYMKDGNGCQTCTCKSSSSSARCPPPPGMRPPCDEMYSLLSKRKPIAPISIPDCRNTGCSQGYACCTDYCGGYTCIPAYTGPTHMCPPGGLSKCHNRRRRRKADLSLPIDINSCHDDSDCKNGQLCCMVDCRKQCVTGWPIAYP